MSGLFLNILDMTVMGSIVILITLLARFLLRKRSKRFILILWAVVVLRLMVPVSIESPFSIFNLIPSRVQNLSAVVLAGDEADPDDHSVQEKERITAAISEEKAVSYEYSGAVPEAFNGAVSSQTGANKIPLPDILSILSIVWIAGSVSIITYCSVRYIMLKIRLKGARNMGGNVYESDKIDAPFVFGLFKPKIYLPDVLDNTEREYIMMHENTHIRHGDWLSKMIGMAVAAVHWFNPLVWLAYRLFEQDIEMSCDEATISSMSPEKKQAYVMSLVYYAKKNSNKRYLVTPLGFSNANYSKSEVANRVKNIINYKTGRTISTVLILIMLITVAAACSLNSKVKAGSNKGETSSVVEEAGQTTKETIGDRSPPIDPADLAPGETTESVRYVSQQEEALLEFGPYIRSFIGCDYAPGGEVEDTGFDDVGLIVQIYKQQCAVYLEHSPDYLWGFGSDISKDDLVAGDIILFDYNSDGVCDHCGIYSGDGKYVHSVPENGVIEESVSSAKGIARIARIVSFDESIPGLG